MVLGIAIVSTSKGLMTGKKAKQSNVGGESSLLRILKNNKMSRIGNNPISIPEGVSIEIQPNFLLLKGN